MHYARRGLDKPQNTRTTIAKDIGEDQRAMDYMENNCSFTTKAIVRQHLISRGEVKNAVKGQECKKGKKGDCKGDQ
jgi:hypothetical protein